MCEACAERVCCVNVRNGIAEGRARSLFRSERGVLPARCRVDSGLRVMRAACCAMGGRNGFKAVRREGAIRAVVRTRFYLNYSVPLRFVIRAFYGLRLGMEKRKELTYDEAYSRLQQIAAEVNGGALSVDRINTMLDEADAMVLRCRTLLYGLEERVAKSVESWKAMDANRDVSNE